MEISSALWIICCITIVTNIPFGYWRANVKKYGLQWYLAIHLPVPAIIVLRVLGDIGFHWSTYIVLVAAFFFGQYLGGKIFFWRSQKHRSPLTSCLVMDLYRCLV